MKAGAATAPKGLNARPKDVNALYKAPSAGTVIVSQIAQEKLH